MFVGVVLLSFSDCCSFLEFYNIAVLSLCFVDGGLCFLLIFLILCQTISHIFVFWLSFWPAIFAENQFQLINGHVDDTFLSLGNDLFVKVFD